MPGQSGVLYLQVVPAIAGQTKLFSSGFYLIRLDTVRIAHINGHRHHGHACFKNKLQRSHKWIYMIYCVHFENVKCP